MGIEELLKKVREAQLKKLPFTVFRYPESNKIEAYIQTVLSMVAIDKMAQTLINKQGKFRMRLFKSLNNDAGLIDEIKLELESGHKKLQRLKQASDDTWEDFKDEVETTWDSLDDLIRALTLP